MDREQIKTLIECSTTFEEADRIISQYGKFENAKEKIAFLKETFGAEMVTRREQDSDEFVYENVLKTFIVHRFG